MNYWWIDKPWVAGCRNPREEELRELFQEGFRTVISLLDERFQAPGYSVEEARVMGYERASIPLEDFSAPSVDQLRHFVETVESALEKGKVVVHCQGGCGRTGTMAAAYWVYKGLSAGEAL